MIPPWFLRGSEARTIGDLYGTIVAQARTAAFYAHHGVPDTVEGRFDLIVLHLVLLLRRFDREDATAERRGQHGRDIGQRLFDTFCRDLDHNLREMGVGDMAVPKHMRGFGEAFYGRQAAYVAALAATDERELEKTLARNIFGIAGGDERAARLARYTRAAARQLDALEASALLAGELVFPSPETFAHA
jgi:cytochrome b pre-mRNA-processing protein 3